MAGNICGTIHRTTHRAIRSPATCQSPQPPHKQYSDHLNCSIKLIVGSSLKAYYFWDLELEDSVRVGLGRILQARSTYRHSAHLQHWLKHTMPVIARPVNESIREINDNSWVIGDRILLSRQRSPPSSSAWRDDKGSFYVISEALYPLTPSQPLSATTHIEKVYDAGEASAVWRIDNAFCKVKILDPYATRERVTLGYLHEKCPLSFATPDVHYHAEYDGRYYIILSRLTDQTLIQAWPTMDEAMKQYHVSRIVNICQELAMWQAKSISGVDGQYL